MPRVAGGVEAPLRRLAPEQAFHGQPPRPSTSSHERRRLFAHRRSPSFSNFEFALEENGDGGGGDGRDTQPQKQQQRQRREQHRSQGLHHPPRCQPRVVDVGCRGVGVGTGRGRTFSYYRLPPHQLRLTIVKLDCSSFDVQVMKSASVLELKLAVEEIFTRSPKGEGMISWSLVWGHFCLCYKDQKLINDKVSLRAFGIKDGDELHFIRHVSVSCCASKQRPRKHRQQKVMQWRVMTIKPVVTIATAWGSIVTINMTILYQARSLNQHVLYEDGFPTLDFGFLQGRCWEQRSVFPD